MKREQKSVPIASIQLAGRNASGVQNIIVNQVGQAKPENWFSGIEFRNACLGQKLHPNLPLPWFTGMRLKYEQITIEPEDVAGGKTVQIAGRGTDRKTGLPRVITFKQPGVHNLNLDFDMNSISMEKFMAMSELSLKFERPRATLSGGTSMAAPVTETITDDAAAGPNQGTEAAGNTAAAEVITETVAHEELTA